MCKSVLAALVETIFWVDFSRCLVHIIGRFCNETMPRNISLKKTIVLVKSYEANSNGMSPCLRSPHNDDGT